MLCKNLDTKMLDHAMFEFINEMRTLLQFDGLVNAKSSADEKQNNAQHTTNTARLNTVFSPKEHRGWGAGADFEETPTLTTSPSMRATWRQSPSSSSEVAMWVRVQSRTGNLADNHCLAMAGV